MDTSSSIESLQRTPFNVNASRSINGRTDEMEIYFPADVDTVKQFALSRNMTCEHLKQYAKSLGLAIKCTGRRGSYPGLPKGVVDRLAFGIKKTAIRLLLKSRYTVIRRNLFKFGVSFKTGLFNASELLLRTPIAYSPHILPRLLPPLPTPSAFSTYLLPVCIVHLRTLFRPR